jgi:syntaxin 7
MSFDHLSSLEAQPTTLRRQDDPNSSYSDDPEFTRLANSLSNHLFSLTSNISRLSNEIAKLGTNRENDRVRDNVQTLLDETKDGFKEVGEGVKKVQSWDEVNVSLLNSCLSKPGYGEIS